MTREISIQCALALVVVGLVAFQSSVYKKMVSSSGKATSRIAMTLSPDVVSAHRQTDDCWVMIDGAVYDVTLYLALHPGGSSAIAQYCGSDGSAGFAIKGGKGIHSAFAQAILGQLKVGTLGERVSASSVKSIQTSIRQAVNNGIIPAGKGEDD